MSNPPRPDPRRRLRFHLLAEVNRGGMGVIHSALDPALGRRVAIKTLRDDLEDDIRVATKFEEEAQVTGQLEHPNIVPIYDLGQGDHERCIVMKLIRGRSLREVLDDPAAGPQNPSGLERFVSMLLRLCDALEYAHSRGVYHCDLKPDNVMVGDFGQVYLMDWGVAVLKTRRLPAAGASVAAAPVAEFEAGDRDSLIRTTGAHEHSNPVRGTPAYMAPEQIWGRIDEIDERTDVFGLGAILCEVLTGTPPNEFTSFAKSAQRTEPLGIPERSARWSRIPPELRRIAEKALSPARDARHPNVAALRADLEQYLRGGGWFETRSYAPGDAILREGDPGDLACIIERGHCDVFKKIQGTQELIRTLGPGDVFGEISVFATGPRTATIVAVDHVVVKVIDADSLNRELDRNPWLGVLVRSLAATFRETDRRLSEPPAAVK